MCGITGILSLTAHGRQKLANAERANQKLVRRGPDHQEIYQNETVSLGHCRLSIIDTSSSAFQPMTDPSGRYTLVFNGEIFNFRWLKEKYFAGKTDWRSHSDTEVLLHLYILLGRDCLSRLDGFFALAIFDHQTGELFLARDRYGKKPLLYYATEDFFCFASEMKALVEYGIPREMNYTALFQYLQLNYIPQPSSILNGVQKLRPGHSLRIGKGVFEERMYYEIQWRHTSPSDLSYAQACKRLEDLMSKAVEKRMISDVPLGAFLSGGIDSSVVVALASRFTNHLSTFSIGYSDNPFFDETKYANLVAEKYRTNHTVFSLKTSDFFEYVDDVLAYLDEPFADSSAIPVYILSKQTRKHVTVALSGDGGDEVFSGYNKHAAEWKMRQGGLAAGLVKMGAPLWRTLPQSRNNRLANRFRQLSRFAEGARLDRKDRYWQWASLQTEQQALHLLSADAQSKVSRQQFADQKRHLLRHLNGGEGMEDVLVTDMEMVLLSDMLVKVDLMSMANSLEIRSPFLDYEVVDFAFGLPTAYKIDARLKKKIVQDAFREYLPVELYNRPKHGFEIPLMDYFRNEMRSRITDDLLNDDFVAAQGLFDPDSVRRLKHRLFSSNPGDAQATVWALIVFQTWWRHFLS